MLQSIPPISFPLRRTTIPFPSYRYVPGLEPHPLKHPNGHMYQQNEMSTQTKQLRRIIWGYGLDLFEHRYMWEAHEAWETLWHYHRPNRELAGLLQGMILGAAACLKKHMNAIPQSESLFNRCCDCVSNYNGPEVGVEISFFTSSVRSFLSGGDWPVQPVDGFDGWQNWP